jgi:replicative DNA helicase
MSYSEVIKAQMSMMLKISSHRMTPKELTEGEKARCRELKSKIDLRLSEHNTPAEIENAIRIMDAAGEKPVAVFVDYIQIMTCGDSKAPRHEVVSRITRELKVIAQKYGILIIALSQFNRDAANEAPALHHLRESGSIEQDANWVLAIHCTPETKDTMRELIVMKNRSGSTGSRDVRWFPAFTLMADM